MASIETRVAVIQIGTRRVHHTLTHEFVRTHVQRMT